MRVLCSAVVLGVLLQFCAADDDVSFPVLGWLFSPLRASLSVACIRTGTELCPLLLPCPSIHHRHRRRRRHIRRLTCSEHGPT